MVAPDMGRVLCVRRTIESSDRENEKANTMKHSDARYPDEIEADRARTQTPTEKETPSSGSERRLVLPRSHGLRHRLLSAHLDAIDSATDAAIHKGYCRRNVRKLDAALIRIIAEAEAARNLIRQNEKSPDAGATE